MEMEDGSKNSHSALCSEIPRAAVGDLVSEKDHMKIRRCRVVGCQLGGSRKSVGIRRLKYWVMTKSFDLTSFSLFGH